MPRPWRTIYKSPHKEVKIRPRSGKQATRTPGIDISGLAVIVCALAILLGLSSLAAEFWLFILIVLAISKIQSKRRR